MITPEGLGTGKAGESPPGRIETDFPRAVIYTALGLALALAVLVFHAAQIRGGQTWDELLDYNGASDQAQVIGRLLSGDTSAHFSDVRSNFAFYGILITLPAYLAEQAAAALDFTNSLGVYTYVVHAAAFACYLLAIVIAFLTIGRATGSSASAGFGASLLALYPLWLGFSFFNHKDVPTACFALLALYAALRLMQSASREQTPASERALALDVCLLSAATILTAGIKLPALALIIPAWTAALFMLLRHRHFPAAAFLCLISGLGCLAITPMAWMDPLNFLVKSVSLMSKHEWNGCTLTAGGCVFVQSEDWSAWRYLADWYSVQLPVAVLLGAIGAIIIAPFRGAAHLTIAASLVFPVLLITIANSHLYDGLRHVLFTIPLIFILATLFWHEASKVLGLRWLGVAAAGLGMLFVWDNIRMFPYNYVSFNLPARQSIDQTRYLTDLWGFSLKEAARLPIVTDSDEPIFGYPAHLIRPYVSPPGRPVAPLDDAGRLPAHSNYVVVAYTRDTQVPEGCSEVQYVVRSLPMGGLPLRLSFAARCQAK